MSEAEPTGEHSKITAVHLQRLAFVYIRQSSPRQVQAHRESQANQRQLAERAVFSVVEHEANAFQTQHVGDLVRVGDDGRDAARHYRSRKLARRHQRTFDVNVSVDESGADVTAAQIDYVPRFIAFAQAGDARADNGNVGGIDFASEDVDQLCVF